MKITVYLIDKKSKDTLYAPLTTHYIKIARSFAQVEVKEIFDKRIHKAQELSAEAAQESYTNAFVPYVGTGYDIALHPEGKEVDSYLFADLLKDKVRVNFYIGGAYGFNEDFLNKCNRSVSFGKITLSHKLIKLVLLEQIYRGLSINANHPYHK